MPIDASNVLLYCPTCRRGVRLGRRYTADGAKERYCKKCGNGLGMLSKPRPRYAQKPQS
jgi:large subunit ribosomal protein L24